MLSFHLNMRIRNRRPSFPPPQSAPITGPAHHLSQGSRGRHLLIGKDWRRIKWSCAPLEKPIVQESREDQHGDMEPTITREMNSLNCVNEEKDMDNCMQNNSSPVSQGKHEGKTDEIKEMPLCATPGYGESSRAAVTVDISLPSSFSELGEKLPLKKRKLYHQWEAENEEARVEDKIVAVEEKNETMQVAMENATPEVPGENAIDVNNKDAIVEVKMAAAEMLDNGWQGNNSINCVVNYESVAPSPPFYSPERHENEGQITSEETFVEPLEKPRRGRKRKQGNYQSTDDNMPVQYKQNQKLKRERSKRVLDDYYFYWDDGCVEKQKRKRRRGRPRKVTDKSLKENWNEEKPKPKRGRPKKNIDDSLNQ